MLPAHLQAVDTSLPSACFLIRVFGCFLFFFFFKCRSRQLPGCCYLVVLLPVFPAPSPHLKRVEQCLGCSTGTGAEGCR